jgi:16S rRNA (cytosine967-C5)-methyltransferase
MTPPARAAAAIGILDAWLAGAPLAQALLHWSRGARYAGSGDRAAVRDLVHDAVRCRLSCGARGGGTVGRALILGGLRAAGLDPAPIFTGDRHAPAPLTDADSGRDPTPEEQRDLPSWLWPHLTGGRTTEEAGGIALALRQRAPVFLRVNTQRASLAGASARLSDEGIATAPVPGIATALQVAEGAARIDRSAAYAEGLVELQDAASQAVVLALPLTKGMKVLDFCAGGGGKTLAIAARTGAAVTAHDANPARMRDLPARAARAGARVHLAERPQGTFDLVLADAPCSGSGSWRRDPAGKWRLTPQSLTATLALQAQVLDQAAACVAPGGWLAYATCSVLQAENAAQAEAFLARAPGWQQGAMHAWSPVDGHDGFFLSLFRRI